MGKKRSTKRQFEHSNEIASLTQEERELGKIYAWIHRRAEFLRKQNAAFQDDTETPSKQTTGGK